MHFDSFGFIWMHLGNHAHFLNIPNSIQFIWIIGFIWIYVESNRGFRKSLNYTGFSYILDGMNAERILIGSESVGDARFFIERATEYAKE